MLLEYTPTPEVCCYGMLVRKNTGSTSESTWRAPCRSPLPTLTCPRYARAQYRSFVNVFCLRCDESTAQTGKQGEARREIV
eukprot:1971793-Rhodomonas_salina.1